jgi:hypothetical protein
MRSVWFKPDPDELDRGLTGCRLRIRPQTNSLAIHFENGINAKGLRPGTCVEFSRALVDSK